MLTETWLIPDDTSTFSELLLPGYSYLSMLRVTSRGGRPATVYMQNMGCCFTPCKNYNGFELPLSLVQLGSTTLCAVLYHPPEYNKDFISEFSDFTVVIMPKCDRFLICCPSSQLVNEFQNLLTSFDLTPSMNAPTQAR